MKLCKTRIACSLLLLVACAPAEGDDGPGEDTDVGPASTSGGGSSTTGDGTGGSSGVDEGSTSTSGVSESSGGESGESSSGEDPEPTMTGVCNDDGVCDPDETCSTCPDECGSCEIEDLPNQRAKYVDGACAMMGDGLSDSCAASAGGPGRFNELQAAIDTLVAGDTLYVHPGDYWRSVARSDSGGVFVVPGEGEGGTRERPIVITAADRSEPPVLHSCNPNDLDDCPTAAIAVYADNTILDHLHIHGRAQIWGPDGAVMQYLECTGGWGYCGDGNWSCLRVDTATNSVVHHNIVHDMGGWGVGEACPPGETTDLPDRGTGLKEFSSDGTIWEFNTVDDAPYESYDLHRNSVRSVVRFNDFRNVHRSGIRGERTNFFEAYGNQTVGAIDGAYACFNFVGQNEANPGEHAFLLHHNTCVRAQMGFKTFDLPTTMRDSVMSLTSIGEATRNVAINAPDLIDHNAYDASGDFRDHEYDGIVYPTLAAWAAAIADDANSVSEPGSPCTFTTDVTQSDDYDLSIAGGVCATLASDGGEVGAFGFTSCVGHTCG